MDYLKRTWADISLDNLNHNYQQLRAKIPSGCRLLGVVKADAYGHGAVPISRHLCELGAEFLAVSNLEEAMQLRRGGIRRPILILGYTPPAYARDLVAMGLRQEVHSLEYARALHEELKGSERRLKVHIKLDTGMSRLGFFAYDHPKTVEELKEVAQMPKLLIEGIFMHFPVADSIDGADANFTHTQFERFTQMLSALKGVGIEPVDGTVKAPVSGVLQTVAETGHAFGLKTDDGIEVLVHVGIDTVKMNGNGFVVNVAKGDRVNAGDLLATVDLDEVKKAGFSTTTLVTVLNTAALKSVTPKTDVNVAAGDEVIAIEQ